MTDMMMKLRIVGIAIAVSGLALASAGFFYGVPTASDGLDSAQAMYEAQGISLNYNDEGKLIDRGTVETAQAIMSLLRDDYDYPVDMKNFDPNDPLVNTRDELMFQFATIVYHVLHGQQAVTLKQSDVPITYRGVTYTEPGVYNITVGAYYADFDRSNVIEGQLRSAWSPLALSLTSFLAAGHANQAVGELARVTSIATGSIGLIFMLAGGGAIWVSWPAKRKDA
jgi:hypothetical protein